MSRPVPAWALAFSSTQSALLGGAALIAFLGGVVLVAFLVGVALAAPASLGGVTLAAAALPPANVQGVLTLAPDAVLLVTSSLSRALCLRINRMRPEGQHGNNIYSPNADRGS